MGVFNTLTEPLKRMSSMGRLAKYSDSARFGDLLAPISYDEKNRIFICSDNALSFGFKCNPLDGADEALYSRLCNALQLDMPTDSFIQTTLYTSENIFDHTNLYLNMRQNKADDMFQKIVDSRVETLHRWTKTEPNVAANNVVRNINLVLSFKIPIKGKTPTEKELEAICDLRIIAQKNFATVGLQTKEITDNDYIKIMKDIIHHGEDASWADNLPVHAEKDKLLKDQVLDIDKEVTVDKKGVNIGKNSRVQMLGVKGFPDQVMPGFPKLLLGDVMSGSRGIKGQFILNFTILYPDSQKEKFIIDKKRAFTITQATGPLVKFVPKLAVKAKGYNLLNDALDDGDRPVKVYFSIACFGKDAEEATENATNVRSYFSELNIKVQPDLYYNLPFFLNSLPFGADRTIIKDMFRFKTMTTRHAAALMPLYADWKGTGTPIMNYISRNGQLMSMDVFDSSTNYNLVVAASSGSGKSFKINNMVTNYLSIGGQVWIIDVGRSYLKLAEVYGGDFICFDDESNICLNPFELIQSFEDESDMILGLLAAMAAPKSQLDDLQMQELLKVVIRLWQQKGQKMIVDDVANELLDHVDVRVRDIGNQLFSFTSKGPYGKFFVGKNNVNFKNRFTVLELEELSQREHLAQVVLLQIIYQIQQDMYLGERDRRKCVVIDEAWQFLSNGNVGKFMQHGFRRARKYGASMAICTQGIGDLMSSETGRAIKENSANLYLLRQKGDAIDQLRKEGMLPIPDGYYELLKTVNTSPGMYSEAMFITEYGVGIGRLIVDPFQILLYSTKAEDVNAIKQYQMQGMDMGDAINAVLRDRGQI